MLVLSFHYFDNYCVKSMIVNSILFFLSLYWHREIEAQVNSNGIDGILSRLEKERSSAFGFNLEKSGYGTHSSSKDRGDWGRLQTSRDGKL